MNAAVPQFMLGKDVSVTLTPLTGPVSGVYTLGSPVSFNGVIDVDGHEFVNDPMHEEISAADSTQANYEILHDDVTYSLQEIMRVPAGTAAGAAAARSILMDAVYGGSASNKFQIALTSGGKVVTFNGVRGRQSETHRGKGKRTNGVQFKQIGIALSYA